MPFKLAPRIILYPAGSAPPATEDGWLALAQLSQSESSPHVFGDGSHPTTRLCAAALDLLCRQRQPQAVLDVGTGTGVLARIARSRGARFVAGTDIDPLALASAEAHSQLDSHRVRIHFTQQTPDQWGARFEVVVANILEEPLTHLAHTLSRALLPGGMLLISGFMRPQAPALRVLYESAGLTLVRESGLEGWVLLVFERPVTAVEPC